MNLFIISMAVLSSLDQSPAPIAEIEILTGHSPQIEVHFPGGISGLMALDTGAENSLVTDTVRASPALFISGTTQIGAGSDRPEMEAQTVRIDQLTVGGYELLNVEMTLFDIPGMPDTSLGVFSPTEFSNSVVLMDFGNGLMSIHEPSYPVPETAISYANSQWGLPEYDVRIGETEFQAVLDSGNPFPILLPMSWMDRFDLIGEPEIVTQVSLVDGSANVYQATLASPLMLGRYTLPGIPVFFIEGQQQANIGAAILSSFVVGMDLVNKQVWLEPASSANTSQQEH